MKKILPVIFLLICQCSIAQESKHNLAFDTLPNRWDEAMPLGNGMIGALVWNKNGKLHFSLDHAKLWDERHMKGLHRKEFSYKWIQEQISKKDYKPVQEYFDQPYDNEPAPTKIPGGAMEFNMKNWGKLDTAILDIKTATALVKWHSGVTLKTFIHATKPVGWFSFENIPSGFDIDLIAPKYNDPVKNIADPVGGDDLGRLGYQQGVIIKKTNSITYFQEGWDGFKYKITIKWKYGTRNSIVGVWTISTETKSKKFGNDQQSLVNELNEGMPKNLQSHISWWNAFWSKSEIKIPDPIIEKQWYLEQYKFGAASRLGAPPISLQAIWTADNGRIPPWKGDYHHDLNTQLSYWPSYIGNHLTEAMAYLDHLDQNKENYKRYTKLFFGVDGLAVPGVTTLNGTEMGGWIQYSLSPTVSSWLSHHYYLHWRYSMDTVFLRRRAYPWIKDVAVFLERISQKDANGIRKLPISSSPEINDNDLSAWFIDNTNYDISLMKFNFSAAKELAAALGLKRESAHWDSILHELPSFSISKNKELMFAPTMEYNVSHRHFSHMMAIHPLGLLKWENGKDEQEIIKNTISLLDSIGPDYWCGYSYAWESNIKARAKDGEGAAKALEIFAKAFCSSNSFHLNGDQTKSGLSKFTYRPFTLEGNFAFAAGLQEMLIQSYAGHIEILPAIPASWKDVSFNSLRTEGAFLVSAERKNGEVTEVSILAEKGGMLKMKNPFNSSQINNIFGNTTFKIDNNGFITANLKPGEKLVLNQISIASSDTLLAHIFNWAKNTANSHVGNPNDPVGPWYEAALPNREAFCIRDVSHQCIGNEILGQSKENYNMMEKFVMNISESKDYCSYWEINRYNKPAPVDYTSDQDFWYNLNANFDIIDACYKLYEWTGNKKYITSTAFDRFFKLTLNEYINRWQLQHDKILQRPPFMNRTMSTIRFKEARGIPSYDESQDNITVAADLMAMITNGFNTYAKILVHTGRSDEAKKYQLKASKYKLMIDSLWWDHSTNTFYDFYKTDQKYYHGGTARSEYLLWFNVINDSMRLSRSLRDLQNSQTEVLSYLPMIFYRYGLSNDAYEYLYKIYTDPRRNYPEASSGAMEGIVRGMMGIEPNASENLIATCPRLNTEKHWASISNIPIFSGKISVMHESPLKTIFSSHSTKPITWRATFKGNYSQIIINGKSRKANHFVDDLHNIHSYVDVAIKGKEKHMAEAK